MPRLTLFLSAALIALSSLPHATSPEAPELRLFPLTELKAVSGGHFITTAEINGRDIDVMVDTGATAVALSYEDAETAGLRPSSLDYTVTVSTANGLAKAAPVTLEKVEIDGVRVSDVNGLVMPEGAMRGSLLGMSFLGRLQSFRVEDGVLYLKN
jgi:aspartyl protease family protein